MTELRDIPVLFDQERHTYRNTETGRMLKGITSTLLHRVFPDKYRDIPAHVLAKAAERGSMVHEEIELAETIGITPNTAEGRNYLKLKAAHGLRFLRAEHTVSDMEHYATNIDAIYDAEDGTVDIADYKITSRFDKESVSWQLSICARFLEMNNPGLRVRNLYGIWLRGDTAELIPVGRHTDAEVDALIRADIEDRAFDWSPAFPDYITQNEESLRRLGRQIRELTGEYDRIKAEVLAKMVEQGDKSFDTGGVLVTVVAPRTVETFDGKRFREDHADLYGQYTRKTETKETLKITLR